MKTKINVRGRLNALEVNQTITLPRPECLPSRVRHAASALRMDYGKIFVIRAKLDDTEITITRVH